VNVARVDGFYQDASAVQASSAFVVHPPQDAFHPFTTVCRDKAGRPDETCKLSNARYWMSSEPPPQWIAFDFGSSRPRSICGVTLGSRLKADDIDFPRDLKVQYSDSSFEGNNLVDWLDDIPLTNAISIVDNEIVGRVPASDVTRAPHRLWRLFVGNSNPRASGKKFVVIRDLRMFECECGA